MSDLVLEIIEDYDAEAHRLFSNAHAYVEGAYMPPYRVRQYREQVAYLRQESLRMFERLTRKGRIDEANDYLDCLLLVDQAIALFAKPLTRKYSRSTLA